MWRPTRSRWRGPDGSRPLCSPPNSPLPPGCPATLVADDLVRWDCVGEARRLQAESGRLAYQVTAPFLHAGPGDPAGLAVAPHWAASGIPRLVTLYDLIPLRAPRHYLPTPAHKERYRARAEWVAAADLILAISEYTRRQAIDLLGCPPGRVVNVGAGVSAYFCPPDGTDDELWRFHLGRLDGRPYVLTVGGSDVRKGTERLIAAVGRLVAKDWDLHLVVVGDLTEGWQRRLTETAQAVGLGDRLVLTGAVDDELLRACYRRAAVTVVPSLAEGSGLPVLESAASGTPALASGTTALAEVTATAPAGFDPTDMEGIADAIAGLLADDRLGVDILDAQQALAAASTWDAVAARAGDALDHLDVSARPGPGAPSHGVASWPWWGPFHPMAGASAPTTCGSSTACPPTWTWTVTTGAAIPDVPAGVRHLPAAALGVDVRPASYDAVVYALGNSAGHLPTVELALRWPGWLWLHEVRLPAIAATALADLDDAAFADRFGQLLERAYPGRAPLGVARRAGRSNLDLIAAGVGLVGPLAERCRGILVNSQLARRLLLLDLTPLSAHPPIHVLPPAARRSGPDRRAIPPPRISWCRPSGWCRCPSARTCSWTPPPPPAAGWPSSARAYPSWRR